MKKIANFLIALLATLSLSAQINGNKNIVTETFPLDKIKTLEINLTADIIVDMQGKNEVSITTDSNIIPYIARKAKGKKLNLNQKEWISASEQIKVVIGAPALEKIISDAHSNTVVKNLEVEEFKAVANVGKLKLIGKVQELQLRNHVGEIDASNLIAQNAEIRITSWGKVTAQVINQLTTFLDEDSKLKITNEPKVFSGDYNKNNAKSNENTFAKENSEIRFINFKIENNSFNRNQYVVVGPKPDGSTFSYGFPMNPGQVRKKYWTNGTKVYKTNWWGVRKLVLTIKAEDEGKTVKIY